MTEAELTLRPMTRAEFDEWLPRQVAGYAAMITASGAMPAQAALDKAQRDTARYFGDGTATPGQLVFRIMAGEVGVGWLWLGVPGPDPDPLMAWVFEIEIEAPFRGRGYGRAAMELRRGRGAGARHDVARAERARAEHGRQVAVREPRVRGHGACR